MSDFAECRARVDRAAVHANTFVKQWNSLGQQDSYTMEIEMESNRVGVIKATTHKLLANDLALELGEMFYQLRAALDGAIWQAVRICGGSEPTEKLNRLEFPICAKPKYFNDSVIHKHPFPKKLLLWLESIQPYASEKGLDDPDCGLGYTLSILHDCARKDRHRKLHVVAAFPTIAHLEFTPINVTITSATLLAANMLEPGCKFLRFCVEGWEPSSQITLTSKVAIEVSVDEIPVFKVQRLSDELKRFGEATSHVIDRFEKEFSE
jgi:hypothetical protein